MAKSESLFSRSFRGFAPDEVIAYIDELNAAHLSSKAESDAKINALSDEISSLKKAGGENSVLREKNTELNAEIERLSTDNKNLNSSVEAQGDKIAELEQQLSGLRTELESEKIKKTAMEKNSREYEAMLADVDSILSSSRRKAEELVGEAEKRAAEIIENAQKEAKKKFEEIISQSDEHLNENMKKVKYLYRRQDELAELFKEHKAKVDSFFASVSDVTEKND